MFYIQSLLKDRNCNSIICCYLISLGKGKPQTAKKFYNLIKYIPARLQKKQAGFKFYSEAGFTNFSVIRSDSPIATYFAASKSADGSSPRGAVRLTGGSVQTPNG